MRLSKPVNCANVAWRLPTRPGICRRWLPVWLPEEGRERAENGLCARFMNWNSNLFPDAENLLHAVGRAQPGEAWAR